MRIESFNEWVCKLNDLFTNTKLAPFGPGELLLDSQLLLQILAARTDLGTIVNKLQPNPTSNNSLSNNNNNNNNNGNLDKPASKRMKTKANTLDTSSTEDSKDSFLEIFNDKNILNLVSAILA